MTKAEAKIAFLEMVANTLFSVLRGSQLPPIVHPNINNANHLAPGRMFKDGTLRGYDIDVISDGVITQLRFIEQNPNKTDAFGNRSTYAMMALQGHQIVWAIDRSTNRWLGRVQNGKWIANEPRAYSNSPKQAVDQHGLQYTQSNGQWVDELQNIAPGDIPGHIEQSAEVEGI